MAVLLQPSQHIFCPLSRGQFGVYVEIGGAVKRGVRVLGAMAIGVSKSGSATWSRADEGFFSRVEALVGLELATLGEGLAALRVITLVRSLACMGAEVCL